jgi:hypothetical protein
LQRACRNATTREASRSSTMRVRIVRATSTRVRCADDPADSQ